MHAEGDRIMLLELNRDEKELLAAVLSTALGGLREEIYKTETADYKIMLKQRESLMKAVQARLTGAETSGLAVGEPVSEH
jgi:hypothetical protein